MLKEIGLLNVGTNSTDFKWLENFSKQTKTFIQNFKFCGFHFPSVKDFSITYNTLVEVIPTSKRYY